MKTMTKEQYLEQKKTQADIISQATETLKRLAADYIDANKQFEIGDRVKVRTPEYATPKGLLRLGETRIIPEKIEYGYVREIGVDYRGDIEYDLVKEKKDGTKSLIALYCTNKTVELTKA